jgi:hypothetical protein
MAPKKNKVLTSAPGASEVAALGGSVESTKSSVAAAVAAAARENTKQRNERIAAAEQRAKETADQLKKWRETELANRVTEYNKRYNTLINDIAKRGGVKNPQNATLVDQAEKLNKQLADLDVTFKKLTQKNTQERPTGVPADAKFDDKAKQWIRGSEKWDSAGKKIVVAKTDTGTKTDTGAKTDTSAKTDTGTKTDTGAKTDTTEVTAEGTVDTTTLTGIAAASGVPTSATAVTGSTDGLKPGLEKIFAEAIKRYGDIDEIFKTNTELRTLLESAIGKVDDPNDDYTEAQFLNLLKNTNWWQSQAGVVRQRGFLKRQYDKLVGKLDKNSPTYATDFEKLNAENEYGRGISATYNTLQSIAQGIGADLTTEQLNSLASKVFSLGYDGDQTYMTKLLTPYVSTVGMAGGTAGQTLQALRQTARANGFDLDTKFGAQMNEWVRQVVNGRSIDDFKNIIREEAAKGQGKYVTDLLRSGYDLDGIYGNYISLMAKNFNIDPTTIKLDDPLLKRIFDDKGGMKFNDFETLLRSDTRYTGTPGMASEKDFRQSIADRAKALGVSLAEADINDIANNVLSMGIGASSSLVDGLIRAKFRYAPGTAIGGFAGNNLAALKQTAAANGLDLDKAFTSSEVQSWLSNILQGESIETYKRRIRQVAGAGLPDKVSSLLDLGSDLESIYSPYKNVMANVLEINPETITVNDNVLRQAIGPEKEMSIYEWERFLRKDPRWQYTNNARASVSDAVKTVAQDFGLAG